MKNTIEDPEKAGDKITDEDKKTIKEALAEAKEWLEGNQQAEKEEFEEQLKDLQSKCQQHVDLSVAYAELTNVPYVDRQKFAWAHEEKELRTHIAALTRHNHYQKTLLKNRTDHISHLEHALHESNAAHREQLHRHEEEIEFLTTKLKKLQDMVEMLTRERESAGPKRIGQFASPRVVIPIRGGGGLHNHETLRTRTHSNTSQTRSSSSSITGGTGITSNGTDTKFTDDSADDVVVSYSPPRRLEGLTQRRDSGTPERKDSIEKLTNLNSATPGSTTDSNRGSTGTSTTDKKSTDITAP